MEAARSAAAEELARAARVLVLRGRRESAGPFAGSYASAFRGSGLEFEESRPYAPGDGVASLDWNATARRGEPWVKRFRAERNQTLWLALDVSASMRFGTRGASKLATAVHAAALLVAAAARAGDRIGLLLFDDALRARIPPGRGPIHAQRVVHAAQAALAAQEAGGGGTRIAAALRALRVAAPRRGVVFLLSDFLDPELAGPEVGAALAWLARRTDLVAACIADPREALLVAAGGLLATDPERPGAARLLATSSRRARRRYREAAAARRAANDLALRRGGADLLHLAAGETPLPALARFLRARAARRLRGSGLEAGTPPGASGATDPRGAEGAEDREHRSAVPVRGRARASWRSALGRMLGSLWILAFAVGAAPGCEERAERGEAPVLPRAALVLDPTRIGVGEIATLELALAAPPRHAARPWQPPDAPPGLERLDVEALPVERGPARWVHRTRVRVRAREVGTFTWPGGSAVLETPEGAALEVAYEPLAIEVVSLLPERGEPHAPFGLREPRARGGGDAAFAWGAAGGAALALAAVAALRARGRRRGREAVAMSRERGAAEAAPAWVEARAALAQARALAPGDPFAAADAAARALRRYAARRFASPAPAQTCEELAARPAPAAATTRWPALVAALGELDARRFAPRGDAQARDALARALGEALEGAERFVAETVPPEAGP